MNPTVISKCAALLLLACKPASPWRPPDEDPDAQSLIVEGSRTLEEVRPVASRHFLQHAIPAESKPSEGSAAVQKSDASDPFSAVTLPESLPSPPSNAEASATADGISGSGSGPNTLCDTVGTAVPNLPKESKPVLDPVTKSCTLPALDESKCRSVHSLWSCHFEANACNCKWRPMCHGVTTALTPKKGRALLCRPNMGASACQCWGSESCPGTQEAGGWECKRQDRAPEQEQGQGQMSELEYVRFSLQTAAKKSTSQDDLSQIQEEIMKDGSCLCSEARLEMAVPLSSREQEALLQNPLEELDARKAPSTAAGIKIDKKETTKDEHGKEHLDLTIKDPDAKNQTEAAVVSPKTPSDADNDDDEHCVITDGFVRFSSLHFVVLGLMMLPAALVLVLILYCNSSHCCGSRTEEQSEARDLVRAARRHPSERRRSASTGLSPPTAFTVLMVLLMVLMKINVTSVLTTAHVIVDHLQDSGALPMDVEMFARWGMVVPMAGFASGVLLAAEPLGGLLGVIIVANFMLPRPKMTALLACGIVVASSFAFLVALRRSSLELMIILRFVSGLGEGALYLGHVYLARLSSAEMRTQIFGYWEMGTAAGLVGGPALASMLASGGVLTETLKGPGEPMAVCVAALALLLFFSIALFFPAAEKIRLDDFGGPGLSHWGDPDMNHQKWTVQLTLAGSTVVRLLLRLAWESAAVMVLATHFCLGHRNSGYGIIVTFVLYMAAQILFVFFCRHFDDHMLIRFCEATELLGLVMMFRIPRDIETTLEEDVIGASAFLRLGMFLLGSAFFYTGNCLTSAPLSSWATKHGPRSETVMVFAHLGIQTGVCAGGLLSRVFTSMDPHQNVIVAMLLPVVVMQILLSELGLGMPLKDEQERPDKAAKAT